MSNSKIEILYEDNHLLVVNKPATLPTMGVAKDRVSLVTMAKAYLKQKYEKPGNVFLGVVSRLDAPVTGVVIFARTSKAASRLADQFRHRRVKKRYSAIVAGNVRPRSGKWTDWIVRHARHRHVLIADPSDPNAQKAELAYRTVRQLYRHDGSVHNLVEVDLLTGRKHQIRIQFSHHGHPIWGDRKYRSNISFSQGIALHARTLTFQHPTQKHIVTVEAPYPASWPKHESV